jgi:hypothetical protein
MGKENRRGKEKYDENIKLNRHFIYNTVKSVQKGE